MSVRHFEAHHGYTHALALDSFAHGTSHTAGKCHEAVVGFIIEIKDIIDRTESSLADAGVELSPKLGVCLDSCHVWDGGFDVVNDLDGVIDRFDRIVGLDRLKAIHLNDSLNGFETHKDRHACIGKGKIGMDALVRIINHPKLRDLPFYLETPNDLDGYRAEIAQLRSLRT